MIVVVEPVQERVRPDRLGLGDGDRAGLEPSVVTPESDQQHREAGELERMGSTADDPNGCMRLSGRGAACRGCGYVGPGSRIG